MKISDWAGCYDEGWGTDITALSYSHPAKMARGLVKRIYAHLLEQGELQPGDVVVDPFAGIGGTALDAITNGLDWLGCELEQRFVDLGAGCDCTGISKADWVRFYGRWERASHKSGRHFCPACLAQAKAAVDESPEQFSLFGPAHSATYRRNSGRIPFTVAHRYRGNIDLFHGRPEAKGRAVLVRGDSRNLVSVIREAGGVVGSPSFADSLQNSKERSGLTFGNARYGHKDNVTDNLLHSYGVTPGQLGAMPEGRGIVSSPPYAGSVNQSEAANDTEARIGRMKRAGIDVTNRANVGGGNGVARQAQVYGDSAGQLGAMKEGDVGAVISSPPYASGTVHGGNGIDQGKLTGNTAGRNSQAKAEGYGDSAGQLSNLPAGDVSAVVSSPPWAGNSGGRGEASRNGIDPALFDRHQGGMVGGIGGEGNLAGLQPGEVEAVIGSPPFEASQQEDGRRRDPSHSGLVNHRMSERTNPRRPGEKLYLMDYAPQTSADNLAAESGETFWQAARAIVEQCAAILPPGAPAVWVIKSFVRAGQIVDFPGQWQALCEACGFETVEIVRAWLVKDKGTQLDLNGNGVKKTVKRASFFRRLHEMKNPHLSIDYEIVLITRRVLQ